MATQEQVKESKALAQRAKVFGLKDEELKPWLDTIAILPFHKAEVELDKMRHQIKIMMKRSEE